MNGEYDLCFVKLNITPANRGAVNSGKTDLDF